MVVLFLVSWDDILLGGDVCGGVEARSSFGKRPAVVEAENDELKGSGKELVGLTD